MTDKHTPGPWKTMGSGTHDVWVTTVSPEYGVIATAHRNVGGDTDPIVANARLIAQAWTIPALRAALEAVKPYLSKICCLEHEEAGLTEIVDAALALANEPADGDQS